MCTFNSTLFLDGYKYKAITLFIPGMVTNYSGYTLLGYYLYKKELTNKKAVISYVLGLLAIIVGVTCALVYQQHNGLNSSYWSDYFLISILLYSIGVFNFFKYVVSKIKLSDKWKKIIVSISDHTMGVYCLHMIVLCIFKHTLHLNFNSLLLIPVYAVCTYFICSLLSFIIKKIPFIGKHII